jgi:hypothetical protein
MAKKNNDTIRILCDAMEDLLSMLAHDAGLESEYHLAKHINGVSAFNTYCRHVQSKNSIKASEEELIRLKNIKRQKMDNYLDEEDYRRAHGLW